jgi:foldase protein PrsA
MMRSTTLRLLFVTQVVGAALLLTACGKSGEDLPRGVVASVGGVQIKTAQFRHWFDVAARQAAPKTAQVPPVPDPPSYRGCVAAMRREPPNGQAMPTIPAARSACSQQYEQLKPQVMAFLLQASWIVSEAHARGVTASPSAVEKEYELLVKESFPSDAAYQRFRRRTGMTAQDLRFRATLAVLMRATQSRVMASIERSVPPVTDSDVANYYKSNPKRFSQPERRDVLLVIAERAANARAAKARLLRGASWDAVAREFSIDRASRNAGGRLRGITRGQLDSALGAHVFAARTNAIIGPVKGQFGYAVFKVTGVLPPAHQTLVQAREKIAALLRAAREQRALRAFLDNYERTQESKTVCAHGFLVPGYCRNAPSRSRGLTPVSKASEPELSH